MARSGPFCILICVTVLVILNSQLTRVVLIVIFMKGQNFTLKHVIKRSSRLTFISQSRLKLKKTAFC